MRALEPSVVYHSMYGQRQILKSTIYASSPRSLFRVRFPDFNHLQSLEGAENPEAEVRPARVGKSEPVEQTDRVLRLTRSLLCGATGMTLKPGFQSQ